MLDRIHLPHPFGLGHRDPGSTGHDASPTEQLDLLYRRIDEDLAEL